MRAPQPQEGDAKAHQLALAQAKTQSGGEPGAEQITGQRQHEQHAHCAGAQLEHVAEQHPGRRLEYRESGEGRHQAEQVTLKARVAQHMAPHDRQEAGHDGDHGHHLGPHAQHCAFTNCLQ